MGLYWCFSHVIVLFISLLHSLYCWWKRQSSFFYYRSLGIHDIAWLLSLKNVSSNSWFFMNDFFLKHIIFSLNFLISKAISIELSWIIFFSLAELLLKIPKWFSSYYFSLLLKFVTWSLKIRFFRIYVFALIKNIFFISNFTELLNLLKNSFYYNIWSFRVMTTLRNYNFLYHFLIRFFDWFYNFFWMLTRNNFII